MTKGITEWLAVVVGSQSFVFFPLPAMPSPRKSWLLISCTGKEGCVAKFCLWNLLWNTSHIRWAEPSFILTEGKSEAGGVRHLWSQWTSRQSAFWLKFTFLMFLCAFWKLMENCPRMGKYMKKRWCATCCHSTWNRAAREIVDVLFI